MMHILVALFTAVFVVAVLVAKDAIVAWWTRPRPVVPVPHDDIRAAVLEACGAVGLNALAVSGSTDLVAAGKLKDVLYIAAAALDKDVELRTVQDVIDWLAEAPPLKGTHA